MTTTSKTVTASPFLPLIEQVRVQRVLNRSLDPKTVCLPAPALDEAGAVVLDDANSLVDVDARISLPQLATWLEHRGWLLPLLRPLPPLPLWRLAMAAPFVVDAVCQQATLITVDGDTFSTPKAPRHSAGPSMLHATTTAVPLAFLTRVKLRLTSSTHTTLGIETHDDVFAVARRMRALVDEARVFAADACGTSLAILGGELRAAASPEHSRPWARPQARWRGARSLLPGDVFAIADALAAGARVATVPFMQRTAVLENHRRRVDVVDVRGAAAALADALRKGPR
jgi:hypothetical protein